MKPWKSLKCLFAFLAVVFTLQVGYFASIYAGKPGPEKPDLVVVYGGLPRSSQHGLELAHEFNCPVYFSESVQTVHTQMNPISDPKLSITIDPSARTTDQNARYAAPFIRDGGFKRVALVCAWHHEPRALFLARLYLLGSSVHVEPYPNESAPERFWMERDFWLQIIKFWGSLGRVVLNWFGINNWPHPQLIRT